MSEFLLSSGVASYISQNILIVPFQADFYDEVIAALQQDVLQQLQRNAGIRGLIIDLSNVNLLDFHNMAALKQTLDMAAMFGVMGFLVGIQPNVTLALVELGYEQGSLNTALNIERATVAIHKAINTREIQDDEQDAFCEENEVVLAKMGTEHGS